jgi:hypothetical protein
LPQRTTVIAPRIVPAKLHGLAAARGDTACGHREDDMARISTLAILFALAAWGVHAQQKSPRELAVGTWILVGGSLIGPDANGMLVLDGTGHMSMQIMSPRRAKFETNARMEGTPDEYKSAVHGMISYFGRWSVDAAGKTLTYQIERSSFPNWDGAEQKRPFTVTATELRYTNATPSSGAKETAEVVWRRAN